MKILNNELATFKNLPLLKHLSWFRISLIGVWCCKHSTTLCQGWQTAQWRCRTGKGSGSSCSWWNDGGSQLRWHAEPWAEETLAAGDLLRNKEEKVYKQIRIHSSKGDDLNIKGLRESLGRIHTVCRFFCKLLFLLIAVLCNHRFQLEKRSPSVKAWFISCSFWKVVYGSNYNGNAVRYKKQ